MKRETTAKVLRRMELRLQSLEKRIQELSKLIAEELYGADMDEDVAISEAHLERLKKSGLLGDIDTGYPDDEEEEGEEPERQPREKWIA